MNSGNTATTMTFAANSIVEKCLMRMANDVTAQVRDKLIDIIIAVLARECDDFDGESVRRLIVNELESTPIAFALEKLGVAKTKTMKEPKTKVVELDADGNPVKKVRPPKEPKEKAPKAAKPVLSDEEREARKAAKKAEKEAAKEARKAEKEATKDADKEATKAAAKAEKEAAKATAKAEKEAEKEAIKAAKLAEKEAAKEAKQVEKEAAKQAALLAKPAKEQRIPIPWCGVTIVGRCQALRSYHGLFAQCTSDDTETCAFCTACEKANKPFGTVAMRKACGLFDYTDPKSNKKCVRLANVVEKFGVEGGLESFIAEAAKHDITIPSEHLEKEVKARGRPKSASPRTKIATSDTGSGSGSETETDDEEYQAKKAQQRKKVTKTASAADAAPKKRGRPAKAKEPAPQPTDDLIQNLVSSAKKSASAAATPVANDDVELIEDDVVISSPAPATPVAKQAAAPAAPAAPKKKVSAVPRKHARQVVEVDGQKFWLEQFNGDQILVSCEDNSAYNTDGEGIGMWDDKNKTVLDVESDDEE
jgi:hypothetical protein